MNIFLNPSITIPFLKHYFFDPGRIERLSDTSLKKYKDRIFKKMVAKAYLVPLYKKKYQEENIHPKDIRGLRDIHKLPSVSRGDFVNHFPDGVVPPNFNKEKGHVICTGGTLSKYCCDSGSEPVCTYTTIPNLLRASLIFKREFRFYKLNRKGVRFAHIGNFNPFKIDDVYENNVIKHARSFLSLKNYLSMQASSQTEEIMKKLDEFKPDVIISYPSIYQDLAYLKRKGFGKNVKPTILFVGGTILDDYTRRYVEDAFNCHMYNTYSSCESGAGIAFECTKRNWHIHSDFFHLEAVDENQEQVAPGERGRLIITRLWGGGTPIIRYSGMEDWVTLGNHEKCSCGLKSPIFGRPVEGRVLAKIVLLDGTIFPPRAFLFITEILKKYNTFKVKKYQIVQKNIGEIAIFLEMDKDMKNSKPSFDELSKQIKSVYIDKTNHMVSFDVIEVDEIKDDIKTGKPASLVISQINQNKRCELT